MHFIVSYISPSDMLDLVVRLNPPASDDVVRDVQVFQILIFIFKIDYMQLLTLAYTEYQK